MRKAGTLGSSEQETYGIYQQQGLIPLSPLVKMVTCPYLVMQVTLGQRCLCQWDFRVRVTFAKFRFQVLMME